MEPGGSRDGVEYSSADVRPALGEFLGECDARGLSPRTWDEYHRLITRFLSGSEAASFGSDEVHRFVFGPGPSGRPPSPSTAAVRRAALVSFFAFLRRRGYVQVNLAAELPRIRPRPPLPCGLSVDEIGRLLAVIPATQHGVRDRAIVITALFTGLRRAELCNGLGDHRYRQLRESGRRTSYEDAVKLSSVTREAGDVARPSAGLADPVRFSPAVLTRREREVVGRLAHGLTNREIGRALGISPGTSARHVENILGKLGLRTRAQITAWAHETGVAAEQFSTVTPMDSFPTSGDRT